MVLQADPHADRLHVQARSKVACEIPANQAVTNWCDPLLTVLNLPITAGNASVLRMNQPLDDRNLTVAEVFESLRLRQEMLVKYCEVESIELTLDTKVRDWQCYGDGMERTWLHNARLVNNWFDMDAPLAEWKVVLRPAKARTLTDVCTFVARHAKVMCIPEPNFLGRPCRTAGAFLMIRKLMSDAGVETVNLRPSSPIWQYQSKGLPEIISKIIQINPELRRDAKIWRRNDWLHLLAGLVLFVASFVLLPLGVHLNLELFGIGLLCFASFIYVWHKSEEYASTICWVEIENVRTFRDLCHLLAEPVQFARK
ncbi:MAG: hypothetical protein KDA54_01050 [Phycisphaerales bacterium]|nr:hypothetical protein [Phycisphaerales bacterium]